MKILSVNAARIGNLFEEQSDARRAIATGIHKTAVTGPVMASSHGIAGDEQADRVLHGGVNKAVYAYPFEHYAFWAGHRLNKLRLDAALPFGFLGENLTTQGLLEQNAWVGDRLEIGDAMLEITEPRSPCFKFGVKMGFANAVKLMRQSGATGFYLKVLQQGMIRAGDAIVLHPGPRIASIAQINEQRHKKGQQELF